MWDMYTHTHAVEYYTTIKNNEYKYTIKDTRTKSRGRIEVGEGGGTGWSGVEGWGENADNCSWIKIKKLKKKNEILPFATTRMAVEYTMLSDVSQAEKDKYHVVSFTCLI